MEEPTQNQVELRLRPSGDDFPRHRKRLKSQSASVKPTGAPTTLYLVDLTSIECLPKSAL